MKYFSILLIFGVFISCKQNIKDLETITNENDYLSYLDPKFQTEKLETLNYELGFWKKKYEQDERGFTYLIKAAALLKKKFRLDGEINHVYKSDSLYKLTLKITSGKNRISAYQGLSQNAILKHQFKLALAYADSAIALNNEVELLLKFDALLELGDPVFSHQYMNAYGYRNDFDFLTRKSKYMDHIGDLDSAILIMEKAAELMESRNNINMICWSYANLGDMYMHAGRPKDSYNAYLKVLGLEASYHYALKGIAWLSYANDKIPEQSLTILNFLTSQSKMPDTYLMIAEINEYMGNEEFASKNNDIFYEKSSESKYLDMYNKYNILLNAEAFDKAEIAIEIAKNELHNRKTPAVYDLLAWSYFMNNELEKAYAITKEHVLGKSSEPELLYHSAVILKNKNMKKEANLLFSELEESQIEIGPIKYSKVLQHQMKEI